MAGSQLEAILAFTAALLASVPGVQRVHTYEVVATSAEEFFARMGDSQDLQYWEVLPATTQEVRGMNQETTLLHALTLRGYVSLGDPAVTAVVFRALVHRVAAVFRRTFEIDTGGAQEAELYGPLQITWPVPVRLADTLLVHRVEGRLTAQELLHTTE